MVLHDIDFSIPLVTPLLHKVFVRQVEDSSIESLYRAALPFHLCMYVLLEAMLWSLPVLTYRDERTPSDLPEWEWYINIGGLVYLTVCRSLPTMIDRTVVRSSGCPFAAIVNRGAGWLDGEPFTVPWAVMALHLLSWSIIWGAMLFGNLSIFWTAVFTAANSTLLLTSLLPLGTRFSSQKPMRSKSNPLLPWFPPMCLLVVIICWPYYFTQNPSRWVSWDLWPSGVIAPIAIGQLKRLFPPPRVREPDQKGTPDVAGCAHTTESDKEWRAVMEARFPFKDEIPIALADQRSVMC